MCEDDRTTTIGKATAVDLPTGEVSISASISAPAGFIYLDELPDAETLASLGRVAIRHSQMDDQLKMTIKTMLNLAPEEARIEYLRTSAEGLRKRVEALAKAMVDDGTVQKLCEMTERCEILSDARNDVIHGLWGRELDGAHVVAAPDGSTNPAPTPIAMNDLARRIHEHRKRLTHDRLAGYLHEALQRRK